MPSVDTIDPHTKVHEMILLYSGGRGSYDFSVAGAVADFMSADISLTNSKADADGFMCGCITGDNMCSNDLAKITKVVAGADALCPSYEPTICTIVSVKYVGQWCWCMEYVEYCK